MPDVTIYFATNRQPIQARGTGPITGFGSELGPIGGMAVRFGSATVSVDLTSGTTSLVDGSLVVAPEQLTGAAGFKPRLGSRTIFTQILNDMKANGRPTLAIIHGFSNTFTDAITRAGWISAFYGIDANIFAFTWPSIGSPTPVPMPYTDYVHDRATAAASGVALARTIQTLHDFVDSLPDAERCKQPIHLVCHSMGNYVLRHGVQELVNMTNRQAAGAASGGGLQPMTFVDRAGSDPVRLRRTFGQIVLAAADEDDDAFDDPKKLGPLPRLAQAVTVYHTERDWILNTLSAKTKFNGPRLGTDGPDNMATISDKVTAVDVSNVIDPAQDFESHQYYRIFPAVRDDIVAVLGGDKPDKIPKRHAVSAGRWRL